MFRSLLVIITLASTLFGCQLESARTSVQSPTTSEVEGDYTCPMHPEIRSKAKGECPKCKMPLVAVQPEIPDYFNVKMEATPAAPKPKEPVKLKFWIFNPKTGALEKEFGLLHEKMFHLFIISQDLSQFQHIHPVFNADGSFSVETVLPQAGRYKVYTDFYPKSGIPQVIQENLTTAGYKTDLFAGAAKLKPDEVMTKVFSPVKITKENAANLGVEFASLEAKTVNDLKVEVKIEQPEIIAGKPTHFIYQLSDAKTGEPIKDLSPYLGAFAHTLILSEDQIDYVHSHPEELPPDPFDMTVTDDSLFLGGPTINFEALLPRPGMYRIWTQFLRGDTMTVAVFTVHAKRLM
jgi:hypothetical protein